MVDRIACGVVLSGESLISLLRSLVRVVGQMANARAQAGLDEKSGIAVCIDWKVWQVCWCVGRSVVPRKNEGLVGQQRVHPIEVRTLLGNSWKISVCICCACSWSDWNPAGLSGMNGCPLLCMGQVVT
jgi:hypothetical protein